MILLERKLFSKAPQQAFLCRSLFGTAIKKWKNAAVMLDRRSFLITSAALSLGDVASRARGNGRTSAQSRLQLGQRLDWDAECERFTNSNEANQHLHDEYRNPWKLA